MFYIPEVLEKLAEAYCARLGYSIQQQLGRGLQGMVFLSNNNSAIKVHSEKEAFNRELQVYGRLAQFGVSRVKSFTVPALRAFDSDRLIIEMSLVRPPFIVDFGGAYLDEAPLHARDPDIRERWMLERKERFGESVNAVNALLAEFEVRYNIFLTDVHPGNIRF